MSGLSGYTGPTSGRITVGGDGTVTNRERFTDKPLTKDENDAVAWFTALSPNEQLREVRRLKWNVDEARKDRDGWKRTALRQREDLIKLERKLASYPPEGYTVPAVVADLLALAKAAGWSTAVQWTRLAELHEDGVEADGATIEVGLWHGLWKYRLRWHCDFQGPGARMTRGALAQTPEHRAWHDAPSLRKIREVIGSHPAT